MPMYYPQQQQRLSLGGPRQPSLAEKRLSKISQPKEQEPPKPAPLLDIEALEKQGKEVRIKRVHHVKRKDLDQLLEPEVPDVLEDLFPTEVHSKPSLNAVYSQQPPPPPLPTPPMPFKMPEKCNCPDCNPPLLPPAHIPPQCNCPDCLHQRHAPKNYHYPPPPLPPPPVQYHHTSPYYQSYHSQQPNYIYNDPMVPYNHYQQPRVSRVNLIYLTYFLIILIKIFFKGL